MSEDSAIIDLTADIVAAHIANNSVSASEIPSLIQSIFGALQKAASPAAPEPQKQEPAVPIRSLIKPDHIFCLEDGAKLKMLKRYLRTRYDLTPEQYRAKWDLPRDYPMVAPNYAASRMELAKKTGLGRKPKPTPVQAPDALKKARARVSKSSAAASDE